MREASDSSGGPFCHSQLRTLTRCADVSTHSPTAKPGMDHVEQIHTNERVPGHSNYYEKDGLRTYGDGEDHEAEPKMTFARMMSLIAMAFRKQRCTFHTSVQVLTCE
jgi:hypothetical protein